MKKGTFIFCTFFLFLCFFISACKVEVKDPKLLQKPDVDISDKQVTLIIHKISATTSYINIYRQEITDDEEPADIINIGIIYPNSTPNDDKTYRFIDKLVHTKSNYIYRVRYADSDGYQYTNWTNAVTIEEEFEGAYPPSANLTYQCPSTVAFTYNDTAYKLTLSDPLISPAITDFSEYQPMLIVNNVLKTEVFKIAPEALSQREPIFLKDHLSADFLDRPIIIEGIVAQKNEYVNPSAPVTERILKAVYWTEPKKIDINAYSDNIITVPSAQNTAGFDYTKSAR